MKFKYERQWNIDGYEYAYDQFGNIHQLNPEPFEYSENYIGTYNTTSYEMASKKLNDIRWSWVQTCYPDEIKSVLDYGYGNGSFLRAIPKGITKYGYDVADTPLEGIAYKVDDLVQADVYTFWDSMEHIEDLTFMESIPCKALAISLPNLKEDRKEDIEWFKDWKHRKPNEHIHHFHKQGLIDFFESICWKMVAIGHVEDYIRIGIYPNILTGFFKRM